MNVVVSTIFREGVANKLLIFSTKKYITMLSNTWKYKVLEKEKKPGLFQT